ncbi:Metallo-dependent phosphatase-like protein [Parasitella parasitica]|nr:Metallo-dependent phosphatase-like protein [Parasitella parasitica]
MTKFRLTAVLLLISSLALASNAYITDIKIVSCDANHACANYPGYYKIPTDLNQGVDGAGSVYLHYKQHDDQSPITELQIVQGNNDSHIPNLAKWTKINVDLNSGQQQHDETSLWLYYTKDISISKNPITSIIVKQGTSPLVSAEYKRIPVDLNQGVAGFPLFMYYSQDGPKNPITSITAKQCFTSNCFMDGWERVEKDLNKGVVVGMSVYLFYKRESRADPVTDVVVILNKQTPPQGYTKVDVNLNSILRGDAIYLWYKTTPSNPDVKRDAVQELAIEFGKYAVTPFGWSKINVDLNSAKEGKEGFGEPTFLYFKKGFTALPKLKPLSFNDNGEFKILQLADLHFTNEEGSCQDIPVDMDCNGDATTIEYMERMLDREEPDLVVFSGDNINGGGVSDARAATFKFAEPVVKRKIPWAVVFGNHDDENDLTREELLEVMKRMPYSLTERGPVDLPGIGNYILKVYSNNTNSAAHDFTMYFLDSHAYPLEEGQDGYDFIKSEQLDWVIASASTFQKLPTSPAAAAFFHIPIWEYHQENDNKPVVKLGDAREEVSSPKKNKLSALEAFKTAGDIKVTSCGHDHVNDYCLEKEGIQLCYAGGAGVGGYGAEHLGWPRRSRVFLVSDYGSTIQTWKRTFTKDLPMFHFQTVYSAM